ncbi:hypothetical protein Bxe_A2587 [Paraburkholderia xenovorans LB400]|uniref:Uncharacterized protein n=2 Tax=Paraburkholderia xenovorans TaxID=36873 RepID=Q13ZU6_PARXL|nr:hypothetical protein Bxe_A2587 [Paraburkholderia xenovorans LB400]
MIWRLTMLDVIETSWKGHTIKVRPIAVRQLGARKSSPDSYIAIVQIQRDGLTVSDWHLPRFSQRWASKDGAAGEALDYAVQAINDGALDDPSGAMILAA